MKVTPVKKKFGKYVPGEAFELPDRTAKVFIKLGKLSAVAGVATSAAGVTAAAPTYQTRMLQAETPVFAPVQRMEPELDSLGAEWNETLHASTKAKNADGTWRKRPGPRSADE